MPRLPPAARHLAEQQFGSVARRQLLRWLTEGQVEGLVDRGALTCLERGVYGVPGGAKPVEQAPMAAVLRTRDARVAGPFVLGLYRAEGFSVEDPFVVLRRPGRNLRGVDFRHMVDRARGRHAASWGRLPTVTPTLALLEAARPAWQIGADRLLTAFDSLRWGGMTTTARLRGLLAQLPTHPGHRRLQHLFDDGRALHESGGERELARVLARLEPPPEPQVRVGAGRRGDFGWRVLRTILEYDGEVHLRPARAGSDAARDAELTDDGILVLRVIREDLEDPDALLSWVVFVLARRARELGLEPLVRVVR